MKGESLQHVCISFSEEVPRKSDFLYGLPMSKLPSSSGNEFESAPLSAADRIRLVYGFISSTPEDRGLGIIPGRKEWDLVESLLVLHDHNFNDQWIRLWTRHRIANVELEKIRDQVCLAYTPHAYS